MPDGETMRESTQAKYEDALFMLDAGEHYDRVASRLGMTPNSLGRLLLRGRQMEERRSA